MLTRVGQEAFSWFIKLSACQIKDTPRYKELAVYIVRG